MSEQYEHLICVQACKKIMFNLCLNSMNILCLFRIVKYVGQFVSEHCEHLICVKDCKIAL